MKLLSMYLELWEVEQEDYHNLIVIFLLTLGLNLVDVHPRVAFKGKVIQAKWYIGTKKGNRLCIYKKYKIILIRKASRNTSLFFI